MRLGEIIRNYRVQHQISMGEFAKLSGISKPYVSMLESNKNSRDGKTINPSVVTLQKISRAVDIPMNDLLRILDDEQVINLSSVAEDDEEAKLLTGYRGLSSEGKRIVQGLIGQLENFNIAATL